MTKWLKLAQAAVVGTAAMLSGGVAQSAPVQIVSGIDNVDLMIRGPASAPGGTIVVPDSDSTRHGRTTYKIFVPNKTPAAAAAQIHAPAQVQSPGNPPYAGYEFETPASLACIYGLVAANNGCDPNKTNVNATSGSKVVCIVAFGHDTSALADLQTYSTQFNLPSPSLTVLSPTGSAPANDPYDSLETSLDLDMAHAMSPNAPILLVEGPDDLSTNAKFGQAVSSTVAYAVQQVQLRGGGVISISYGGSEFSQETTYESSFANTTGVSIFVSSGDSPETLWPSVSPNVVSVGGTGTSHATLVPSNAGQFKGEVAWDQGGGGFSPYHPAPSYQSGIAARLGNINERASPDIAADADPATGVWVYCSSGCNGSGYSGWLPIGGTSVASPLIASAMANAGTLGTNSADTLAILYSKIGTNTFFDVTRGLCGPYAGYQTTAGTPSNPSLQYDLCTGLGAPRFQPPQVLARHAAKQ